MMQIQREVSRAVLPALLLSAGLFAAAHAAPAPAAARKVVGANTVVKVKLDDKLSTKDARKGDKFTASLAGDDYSGLPEGTKFEGIVTESLRPTKTKPGVLNVKFTRAYMPDGSAVGAAGVLASLEEKDVKRDKSGRLESKGGKGKFETKWLGYGAGGGAVLSAILGGGILRGALIGAAGGAAYSYLNKNKKKKFSDVELSRGTHFGIRLNTAMAFTKKPSYHYASYEPGRDRDRSDRDRDRDDRDRDRDKDRDR